MEAGRQLDALVAEKVMGLNVPGWAICQMNPESTGPWDGLVCEDDEHAEDAEGKCGLCYIKLPVFVDHCGCKELDEEHDFDFRKIERLGHYCSCLEPVPFYSADISAAWQVVEKLCNWDVDDNMLVLKGQGPDSEEHDDEEGEWWEADIAGCAGHFVGCSKTAPHAICLAGLKAVGYVDELFEKSAQVAMRQDFSEEEVEQDIAQAVKEVRQGRGKRIRLKRR